MEQFDALWAQTIDSTLGMRCKWYGYQYSEILCSLMCVYLCGGSCVEDVTTHLMRHLSLYPSLRTCSADIILLAIKELTCENATYQSASSRAYDFDHQFIETEKYDANPPTRSSWASVLALRPSAT